MKDDQIAWYEQTGNALKTHNGGQMMPSLLFQHIPVPETYELLRRPKLLELPDSVMGQVSWAKGLFVLKDDVKGTLGEGPCSPDFNNGQFQSWVNPGDVLGAFFGHDHVNDFEGYVDGIMLGYCRTAGFVAYGDRGHQAVRLITLDENNPNTFSTEMLSMKQLGLRAASVGWLDHALTERQQYKLFIGLAVVALFPTLVGTLAVMKYVLK
ncbi:hypothetical protein SDC9_151416 [bioreactor metagenome]|uniref:Calcineurin-like phosphoesterase domain-containing protein n=1 Tax=bioreactor metagenome TaxID=1076179 RepID=A0A645ES02_9ZZZZ